MLSSVLLGLELKMDTICYISQTSTLLKLSFPWKYFSKHFSINTTALTIQVKSARCGECRGEVTEQRGEAVEINHIQHMTIIQKYCPLEVSTSQLNSCVSSWFLMIHSPLNSLEKLVMEMILLKILTKRQSLGGHTLHFVIRKRTLMHKSYILYKRQKVKINIL